MNAHSVRVVADENLGGIDTLRDKGFDLTLLPGREIRAENIKNHDALLVRSITRVDETLLGGSGIHFVGTATSGIDHVDTDYLRSAGIALAHAGGSNAEAVVDYCLSAMAHLGQFERSTPPTVGIAGFGQVGGRLYNRLLAMGIEARVCDPIVASTLDASLQQHFVPLEALSDCNIISLHVPLTDKGEYPTRAMVSDRFLERLSAQTVLIHSARGGVVDEVALLKLFHSGRAPLCAFDVWQAEPSVNPDLVAAVQLASPHIAGYSKRAKTAATAMVVRQLEDYVARRPLVPTTPDPRGALKSRAAGYPGDTENLSSLIQGALDLPSLSARFKQAVQMAGGDRLSAASFDALRSELRERAEFSEVSLSVSDTQGLSQAGREFLLGAGFAKIPALQAQR